MVEGKDVKWSILNAGKDNFIDFNKSVGWYLPGNSVEKIWIAKAAYACTYIISQKPQKVKLLFGSNSSAKVLLNKKEVYSVNNNRNAVKDQDTIALNLKQGKNILLVKVGNSNSNLTFGFFGELKWQWGFFARLVNEQNQPLTNCEIQIPIKIDV